MEQNEYFDGKTIDKTGYILIRRLDHPYHNATGYVREHRLIYEESRNCCLLPWIDIHHMDGNRTNNVWYNLIPMTHSKHITLEKLKDMSHYICSICRGSETRMRPDVKIGLRPHWQYSDNGEPICDRCYNKMRYYSSTQHVHRKPTV